jgi:hypothetical protein
VYEGGLNVPSFWRWPGRFPAGTDVDRIASPIDVLPTLAEACGVAAPADRPIDGTSLLPLLTGRTPASRWPDRTLFAQWHRGDVPVLYRNAAVITDRHKLVDGCELYDLVEDPGETRDVAADHPRLVASLRRQYEQWFEDVGGERGFAPPRIVVGHPDETSTLLTRQDWRVHGADGWSDQHRGHWEVRFGRAGQYRVTVEVASADEPRTAQLQLGPTGLAQTMAPGAGEAVFELDHVPEGPTNVEGWVSGSEATLSARTVRIERVGG